MMRAIAAAAALALASAAHGQIQVIRFTLSGTIDQVTPPGGPIQPGNPFVFSYTFSTNAPDAIPEPAIGQYTAIRETEGQIGSVVLPGYAVGIIDVADNTALGDRYNGTAGAAVSQAEWELIDFGSAAFTGDALPKDLNLADFEVARFTWWIATSEASGNITGLVKEVVAPCYGDCNNDGALNIADFTCFQTEFVTLQTWYPDCNVDWQINIADFACFQAAFLAGCP